jgi:transposase
MPVRPYIRDQGWLLPQRLEDVLSSDHPVRFVATFVDEFDAKAWRELGIQPKGKQDGAPAYDPRLLLSVWLYGFMTGVRSSRKLEAACRETLPYLWLTGRQRPDHNTLWRFYEDHRQGMRKLLRRTVRTAVVTGLVDWALQAVDGSKIAGNASRDRTFDAAGLKKLLERTDAAILDLEARNRSAGEPVPPRLPQKLSQTKALRDKVRQAMKRVSEDEGRTNLTDNDAVLLKARGGFITGYNAQAVASPLAPDAGGNGYLITATDVGQGNDQEELLPMLEAAEENLGQRTKQSLADAGYHSAENLALCQEQGRAIVMPEPGAKGLANPYHKDAFSYDAESDSYTCPLGQTLRYTDTKRDAKDQPVRRYRADARVCRSCPAFGACTKDRRHGRALEIGPHDAALKRHRALMASQAAKAVYSRRKEIIEPVFGIMKEQQAARRFLLRGLDNVLSEWTLLATAFNLRTLAKVWALGRPLSA